MRPDRPAPLRPTPGSPTPSTSEPAGPRLASRIALGLLLGLLPPAPAGAQPSVLREADGVSPGAVVVVLDADDQDENGVPDGRQPAEIPPRDLVTLRVTGRGPTTVTATPGLRLVQGGRAVGRSITLPGGRPQRIALQGVDGPSQEPGDRSVTIADQRGTVRVPVTVVGLRLRRAGQGVVAPHRDAVTLSHAVTNDPTLPRGPLVWGAGSRDPDNLQVEVADPRHRGTTAPSEVAVESIVRRTHRPRDRRARLPLVAAPAGPGAPRWARSPWLRLVGDPTDAQAPGVGDRVMLVGLRDRVVLSYVGAEGERLVQEVSVGRPGSEDGPLTARRGKLRVRVLRYVAGGPPAIGRDDAAAVALAREQVDIANQIWLQCLVDFGDPGEADVAVVAPPPPSLLAIGDDDGLPAAGGGAVRLRVDGRRMPSVPTRAGAAPIDTALDVAAALEGMGYRPVATANARTTRGAGGSADVLVRRRDGELARITADGDAPLSSDRRQTVEIAAVDLRDGLDEFDNMNASSGTLEERALLKAVMDDDPTTVDIVIINRFEGGYRLGGAFIEGDGGAIINALVLERSGILQQRQAWTQAHELGHVLLDHPLHPDNVGPDRPWLLMDADASLGTVEGPKRLTPAECARARARSGVHTVPVLLGRHPS